MNRPPFHLAFPVDDLAKGRAFYGELLGCAEGRSSPEWVDFDFYGHQIVAHLAPGEVGHRTTSAVDCHTVPVTRFGAGLSLGDTPKLPERLSRPRTLYAIQPLCRLTR